MSQDTKRRSPRPLDSINLSMLKGDLVGPPQFSTLTGSGQPVCNFELRTTEDLGAGQTRVYDHPCSAYGDASAALYNVEPGTSVFVRGSLRWRRWHDSNGKRHDIYETIAYHVEVLGAIERVGDDAGQEQAR